ncbi:MAG: gluconokinase, GntK/IdnK-type, partial [Saprospiraceae bacterium]
LLAENLNIPFYDGDDFHPAENKQKMQSGIPLNDEDRYPWLTSLNAVAKESVEQKGCVIACSALKESYRKILMHGVADLVHWFLLEGEFDHIKNRLQERQMHFMPALLLQSQFDTLEIPSYAMHISIDAEPADIVKSIINELEY